MDGKGKDETNKLVATTVTAWTGSGLLHFVYLYYKFEIICVCECRRGNFINTFIAY